jgi:cell fate regulator YaaT (PSP1 superfamily)
MKLIGIKFRKNNRIYKFCPNDEEIKKGDYVVVKKEEGESVGEVVELAEVADSFSLPIIERKATQEDREKDRQNTILEETAFSFCLERILAHKLEMKLVRVECLLNKDKLIFYYTADGRVDFRELLKDLVK